MGITVGHQPKIAPAGNLAISVGKGQRGIRDQEFSTQTRQEDESLSNQRLGIYASLQKSREGHEAAAESQASSQEHAIEVSDRRQAQYLEAMEAKDRLDREKTSWEYSATQQKEKEKLDQGRSEIRRQLAAGEITQDEYEQFNQQLDAREFGIMPVRKYNNEPTPQEIMAQRTWVDPETSDKMYMEPNGRIKNLSLEQRQLDQKAKQEEAQFRLERQAAFNKTYADLMKSMTVEDLMGKTLPSHEAVMERAYMLHPDMRPQEQPAAAQQTQTDFAGPDWAKGMNLEQIAEAAMKDPALYQQNPEFVQTSILEEILRRNPNLSPEEAASKANGVLVNLGVEDQPDETDPVASQNEQPADKKTHVDAIKELLLSGASAADIAKINTAEKSRKNREMWDRHNKMLAEKEAEKSAAKQVKVQAYESRRQKAILKTHEQLAARLRNVTDPEKVMRIQSEYAKILRDRLEDEERYATTGLGLSARDLEEYANTETAGR